MKKLFALLQSPEQLAPPDDTHDDIEIYFRRRRGRNQGKFSKLHILIIEIVALLSLLIGAATFIKYKIDSSLPPSINSHQQPR